MKTKLKTKICNTENKKLKVRKRIIHKSPQMKQITIITIYTKITNINIILIKKVMNNPKFKLSSTNTNEKEKN